MVISVKRVKVINAYLFLAIFFYHLLAPWASIIIKRIRCVEVSAGVYFVFLFNFWLPEWQQDRFHYSHLV